MAGNGKSASTADFLRQIGVRESYAPALSAFLTPTTTPQVVPVAASGPAPGDPGFAQAALGLPPTGGMAAMGPPPPPVPSGPAPGERGFAIPGAFGPPPSAAAPPAVGPGVAKAGPPAPPMSMADQIRASNASIDQTVSDRGGGRGVPSVTFNGKLPAGAGQVDLSGITTPKTAMQEAAGEVNAQRRQGGGGGGGPIHVGWVPASRQAQNTHGMSETETAPIRSAQAEQQEKGEELAGLHKYLAERQGIADAAYAAQNENATRDYNAKIESLNQKRDQYVKANLDYLNQLSAKAQAQIDPDAYFKEKGTLGSIIGALGVALGQFGASLNGGVNTANQIIQAGIDRNVNAQMANVHNAKGAFDMQSNLYGQNLQAFGDRERAAAATKVMYLDQVKVMLDAELAKDGNQKAQAGYLAATKALAAEREAAAKTIATASHDQITTAQTDHFGAFGGAGGPSKETAGEAKWLSTQYREAGIPQAQAQLEDVDKAIDAFGDKDIPGIGPIMGRVPAWMLPKDAVAGRQAVATIKNATRKSIAGSSLTDGEKAELDKQLEGAGDAASLRNVVRSFRGSLSNQQRNIAAGASPEGNALYGQRGGSVKSITQDKPVTPYLKPVDGK